MELELTELTGLEGLEVDNCVVVPSDHEDYPAQMTEATIRLIAAMVVLEGRKRWTVDQVRQLPDGVIQEIGIKCFTKRERDQELAAKNFEAALDAPPTVSLVNSGKSTLTECSPNLPNDSSQNGPPTSTPETPPQETPPDANVMGTDNCRALVDS